MTPAHDLLTVRTIQDRVKTLAASLGRTDFTIRASSPHDGSPHIEVDDAYYFVVCERGVEFQRRRTTDLDELLYWILEGLTSNLAWKFELQHRRAGEDSRRQALAKQVELLSVLSLDWAARRKDELAEILSRHPFQDV